MSLTKTVDGCTLFLWTFVNQMEVISFGCSSNRSRMANNGVFMGTCATNHDRNHGYAFSYNRMDSLYCDYVAKTDDRQRECQYG